jgi:hypothetical protein
VDGLGFCNDRDAGRRVLHRRAAPSSQAIVWDLVSPYLILARIRTGAGLSAVPLLSWIIYFLWLAILKPLVEPLCHGLPLSTAADHGDLRLFGALTLFHLLCQ